MPYQISFTTIKKLFQKNSASALQQSIELSSSSEIDKIIQEWEVIFKKNPTLGLPEVSQLIDSAISKRQEDQRKHSYYIKGKMDSPWAPRNLTSLDGLCYEEWI